MKDYLNSSKKPVKKFQQGGQPMAPEQAAPQGPDMEAMLMQAYETQDPNAALEVVNMIVESMGGGAPAQPAPAPAEGAMPMGRYGMKIPKVKLK